MIVEAYAKVNLTLEVLGKRVDGYHALRSIVAPISLADTLTFELNDDGLIESDTGYGEKDLAVRAARSLAPSSRHGVRIAVVKRIPVGGGLGGGSADAAATLLALNELWDLKHTPEKLAEIGASVGSDVPALVLAQHYREAVLMEGRGEVVSRIEDAARYRRKPLVLANPGVHSSTPAVFKAFVRSTYPEKPNDLEAPATALYPQIAEVLDELTAAGASEVRMSGSGATVFGFARDESAAESVRNALVKKGYWASVVYTL